MKYAKMSVQDLENEIKAIRDEINLLRFQKSNTTKEHKQPFIDKIRELRLKEKRLRGRIYYCKSHNIDPLAFTETIMWQRYGKHLKELTKEELRDYNAFRQRVKRNPNYKEEINGNN